MGNLLSLISLLLLAAFALLYVSKSLEKKPDPLVKVVDLISQHLDLVALPGLAYGIVAFFLTLLEGYGVIDLVIHLVSNVLIALMALPFTFDRVVSMISAKYPEQAEKSKAIIAELKNFSVWIVKKEKAFGYTGAAFAVLMLVITFR
jgi:hypothetical protein